MNIMTAIEPQDNAFIPLLIESCPRVGAMVLSSTICTLPGNAPALKH